MKKVKSIFCLISALIIAVLCFAGCAANSGLTESAIAEYEATEKYAYYDEDMAYIEEPASEEVVAEEEESVTSSSLGGLDEAQYVENDRKLIYNSDYSFETTSFEEDYNAIISAIEKSGGFLSNEYTQGVKPEEYGDSGRYSELTARIPVDSYNTFIAELEGVGNLISKNRSTQDVTTDYYDNDARIELYEEHYNKLMGYLENAESMEDIITIESEMTEVLYQLDTLQGNKRYMDDLISYCTVNINLNEVVNYTSVPAKDQTFGEKILEGLSSVISWLGEFFENFAIVFISALPILAILFGIFAAIFFPIKASRKKKALKNAQNKDK